MNTVQLTYDAQAIADLAVNELSNIGWHEVDIDVVLDENEVFYVIHNPMNPEETIKLASTETSLFRLLKYTQVFLEDDGTV